jgi:hypothetical protein
MSATLIGGVQFGGVLVMVLRVVVLIFISINAWAAPQKVLFVGNSYTAFSGPESLEVSLAKIHAERHPDDTETVFAKYTVGGASLAAHLVSATNGALKSILEEGWDIVVLQDQSQIPGLPQSNTQWQESRDAAVQLSELVGQAGAETRLFLTWGRHSGDPQNAERFPDYSQMQEHLSSGYSAYAEAIDGVEQPVAVVPVGEVWRSLHDALVEQGYTPTQGDTIFSRLYLSDGSHPSHLGTYLAACTFYASLMGESPVGLAWSHADITEDDRIAVQAAVAAMLISGEDTESSGDTEKQEDPDGANKPGDEDPKTCACSSTDFSHSFFPICGLLILAGRRRKPIP